MTTLKAIGVFALALLPATLGAQTLSPVNAAQQTVVAGLRSSAGAGSFPAAAYAPGGGALYLLYDQHDGVRILKLNPAGTTVLAQVQIGAAGDAAVALATDPAGNVYVTGTTTSGQISGSGGAAFPTRADTSLNSFVAKFDANLNVAFVSYLGAGRTAATAVAATADAVFITGITYSATFPVTATGIQQMPAANASQNGFVERFSASGALVYATYLTGANGITGPAAIAADTGDNVFVAGSTTAPGYPTFSALVPRLIAPVGGSSTTSGFLTRLTPAGDGFVFSTFIPGGGVTGLALDGATLDLVGPIALGQFPVAAVPGPLAPTTYQSLLRIPVDGQSVAASAALAPGLASSVSVDAAGSAWVAGVLATPLFPGASQPLALFGDAFALHVNMAAITGTTLDGAVDQTVRFGGQAVGAAGGGSLTTQTGALAAIAGAVALPGTITASGAAGTRFDLPLVNAPNAALPTVLRDLAASCSGTCTPTAATLNIIATNAAAPALAVSLDALPNLTLRNLGSATATGLALTATGFTLASDCPANLAASAICSLALTGSGPGTLTVSAANAGTQTFPLAANAAQPDALALAPAELGFGIVTAASPAARTLTVTNLSGAVQSFASMLDATGRALPYTAVETSDCPTSGTGAKTLAAGSSCHITVTLTASANPANDGPLRVGYTVGMHDVTLAAFLTAADLTLSAAEIDFGTQFVGGLSLPRFLYLSNNGALPLPHTPVALPAASPFAVTDNCASTLEPHSVCQMALRYSNTMAPAADAVTLALDAGLSVLVTGETLPQQVVTGSTANPNVSVSPGQLTFTTPVVATGVSGSSQAVTVSNTGGAVVALALAITGDFTFTSTCPPTLAAGASCTINVSFTPAGPGARTGLLAVTAGSGFAPAYVALAGTALPLLPANNGLLDLGQTYVGEPIVAWYKVQQALASLTASTGHADFGVAIVEDTSGRGVTPTLPAYAFQQTATGTCSNCWLGVQFLSQSVGTESTTLALTTAAGGKPYVLTVQAESLAVSGLLLTPIAQDFGAVPVHSSAAAQIFTLTNLLPMPAAVSIQTITATGDFSLAANSNGGAACVSGGTLAPNASCFVAVTFAPSQSTLRTGTLTITTSAGTVSSALHGNGLEDPGIALNPNQLDFRNVPGIAATTQTVTVSNTSQAPLLLTAPTISSAAFAVASNCPATLNPGALCTLTVQYTPGTGPVYGARLLQPATLLINGQTIAVSAVVTLNGLYTAEDAGLEIVPGTVNFGTTATGTAGLTRQFTLNNLTAHPAAVTLTMPRQFALATPAPCATLAANGSCTFSVTFLPATGGPATGTVFATATPTDGTAGTLQALAYMLGYGAATGALSIHNPASIPNTPADFGNVASGQSAAQTFTLTNSGTAVTTVRRVLTEPPFFASTTCGAALAAAQSCTITVTYSPLDEVAAGTTAGPRHDTGSLMIESDAASSPDTIALTATAIPVQASSPVADTRLATVSLSESALTFANTPIGSSAASQTLTLTNTGTVTLHVAGLLAPVDFPAISTCGTLAPGSTCTITVGFAPTTASAATARTGTLEVRSNAADALEFVTLFGVSSAAPLTLTPAALDFGTVNVGGSGALAVVVTNNTAAPVALGPLTATGDYTVTPGTCPQAGATLAAGASCTLQVMFTPTAAGTRTGTLSVASNATALPLTVSLTGIAEQAHLTASPGALAFGSIAVGAPATLSLTLLNTGTATVTGIAITIAGPGAGDFAVTTPCSSTSLAPNQGCTVIVTFTPSAVGTRAASLAIASSDPASPIAVPLTGSGVAAGSFTLTVNGGSTGAATVKSGSPASYTLAITPTNGFAGTVALTCAPVTPAVYASCSLAPSQLVFTGASAAQNATATINTITSAGIRSGVEHDVWLVLLLLPAAGYRVRRRRRHILLLACLTALPCSWLVGCGGSPPGTNPNLRYSPAGSYQYQVTATSTSGTVITQTVTLNLTVQ